MQRGYFQSWGSESLNEVVAGLILMRLSDWLGVASVGCLDRLVHGSHTESVITDSDG